MTSKPGLLVAVALLAGCPSKPTAMPCATAQPATLLYEGYCADQPDGLCMLDHKTSI